VILIQAGGDIVQSGIHKLINFIINKEKLPDQWKESVIVPNEEYDFFLQIIQQKSTIFGDYQIH
jgi:hypothetical protein